VEILAGIAEAECAEAEIAAADRNCERDRGRV